MHSLPVFLRLQGRAVMLLGNGDAAAAKRRLLERAGAEIVGEETQAPLAIVAIENEAEALAAVARLKARGILVNAVDRPDQCDFTLPAIVDRDPVLIAVGTGGASAGLAKALRLRIEAILPATLGRLASGLFSARSKLREQFPDTIARRHALDAALLPGGALDPLAAHGPDAVEVWLAATEAPVPNRIECMRLRSDNPDDLTLAEARWLGTADHVRHTGTVPPAIRARARADASWDEGRSAEGLDGLVLLIEGLAAD